MKHKQVRQGKEIEVSGMSIIPVECVVIDGDHYPQGFAVSVQCTPIGVILDDGSKRWALGIDGESVDLAELGVLD